MSEEIFSILFDYIYMPFTCSIVAGAAFFWRLRENDRAAMLEEISKVDERLKEGVSHQEVKEMIDDKFDKLDKDSDRQIEFLLEIKRNTILTDTFAARIDERLKSVEKELSLDD